MSDGSAGAARLRRMLFEAWGPTEDPIFVSRAPGRVNLIGEHTDYNEGLVLPAAISLELSIAFRPRTDRRVELHSLALGETRAFDLDDVTRPPARRGASRTWIDYVAGTAWALAVSGIQRRGLQGVIESRLPAGAGLASSAALELASAWALIDPESGVAPAPVRLAALARRAEEEFVGVRCGVMDQMAAALGREGHALLIDCRSLEVEPVPLPNGVSVVVCDSGVPRRLSESRYNERREQCEEGARLLRQRLPRVGSLRDMTLEGFERWKGVLPKTIALRCEHVIRENARVEGAVRALRAGALDEIGALFAESQASLRDLYEVSSPELDALVEAACGIDGVVGARLTGAGFGGCTVNLVMSEAVDAFRRALPARYAERTGRTATIHVVEAVDGAGLIRP
jgi:galactokinase